MCVMCGGNETQEMLLAFSILFTSQKTCYFISLTNVHREMYTAYCTYIYIDLCCIYLLKASISLKILHTYLKYSLFSSVRKHHQQQLQLQVFLAMLLPLNILCPVIYLCLVPCNICSVHLGCRIGIIIYDLESLKF